MTISARINNFDVSNYFSFSNTEQTRPNAKQQNTSPLIAVGPSRRGDPPSRPRTDREREPSRPGSAPSTGDSPGGALVQTRPSYVLPASISGVRSNRRSISVKITISPPNSYTPAERRRAAVQLVAENPDDWGGGGAGAGAAGRSPTGQPGVNIENSIASKTRLDMFPYGQREGLNLPTASASIDLGAPVADGIRPRGYAPPGADKGIRAYVGMLIARDTSGYSGAGRAMIRQVVKYLDQKGVRWLEADSAPRLAAYYTRLGLRQVGTGIYAQRDAQRYFADGHGRVDTQGAGMPVQVPRTTAGGIPVLKWRMDLHDPAVRTQYGLPPLVR